FFPGAHVFAELDQLARAFFFELRTDPGEFAALRNHQSEHSLAGAPAHAGEVEHTRARLEIDGVDLLLAHQTLRFGDARLALVVGDWNDVGSHARQALNRIGKVLLLLDDCEVFGVGEGNSTAEKRGPGNSGGKAQESSSVGAHGLGSVMLHYRGAPE